MCKARDRAWLLGPTPARAACLFAKKHHHYRAVLESLAVRGRRPDPSESAERVDTRWRQESYAVRCSQTCSQLENRREAPTQTTHSPPLVRGFFCRPP
ncbi:hypothetical protein MTO96_000065 [Rhipicephalus appendiculatus]